jgi:hypothetical protein
VALDPVELTPELGEVVARARRRAASAGELQARPGPYRSPVPPEAADAVLELLRDGTYAAAVARVVAEDPDLADE